MTGSDNPLESLRRLRAERMADDIRSQHADPVAGVRNAAFLSHERYRDQNTRADRVGAHPDIVRFEKAMRKAMAKIYVPVFAHNMVRDAAHQNALYVQGVSLAKAGESPHNYGLAVDIIHSTKAWDMTREQWEIFGHVGKEVAKRQGLAIVWGGDWARFWDPAHWEMEQWRTRKNWKLEMAGKELELRLAEL